MGLAMKSSAPASKAATHHVEQNDVGAEVGGDLQRFAAIGSRDGLVAFFSQVVLQQLDDVGVVINHQNRV